MGLGAGSGGGDLGVAPVGPSQSEPERPARPTEEAMALAHSAPPRASPGLGHALWGHPRWAGHGGEV